MSQSASDRALRESPAHAGADGPLRVLLIDDDEIDRLHVRRVLTRGFDQESVLLEECVEGAEALAVVRSGSFDCILLDHHLGSVSGLEVLQRLRQLPSHPPVIAITSQGDGELVAALMRSGAAAYLPKTSLDGGRLVQLVGTVVREARQRQELRRTRERLHLVMEATSTGVFDVHLPDGPCVVSVLAQAHLGVGGEEITPADLGRRIGLSGEDAWTELGTEGRLDVEIRGRTQEGKRAWIRVTGSVVEHDGNGEPSRILGTTSDVSRLKEAQAELARESVFLETVAGIAEKLAAELERDDIVQFVTDEATRLTGAEFGAFFYNVLHETGEAYLLYTLSGAPKEAFERFGLPRNTPIFAPTFGGERVVRHDDVTAAPEYGTMDPHRGMPEGHLPVRSYLAVPVKASTGEVLGGLFFGHHEVGVFTEASERMAVTIGRWAALALQNARLFEEEQRSRRRAQEAVEDRDQVLAVVTHDLRNPLNAALGAARLLADMDLEPEDRQATAETVARSIGVMDRLIQDLLDISRISAGAMSLHRERMSLQPVFDQLVAMFTTTVADKGITLVVEDDFEVVPLVEGDPKRLLQVFSNLVSNAVRHTPAGGQVHVSARPRAHWVEVEVRDSGSGIDEGDLPHLFERFWQAPRGERGGAGLGLAIVKGIVEAHEGEVSVRSRPGEGATFTVRIPAARSS